MTAGKHTRPADDEVEVSLFGPGIGECVVLHLGLDAWIIVDSCIDRASREPAALQYLRELGVDVSVAVKRVVVTHWHDDHLEGAATILREAESAKFVCAAALRVAEFQTLVGSSDSALMVSSGVAEFASILETLRERRPPGVRKESVGPIFAKADTVIYRRGPESGLAADVYALSPSDGAMMLSWHEVTGLLVGPAQGQPKRRAVSLQPNKVAVTLWVTVGNHRILLGADLEEGPNPLLGWKAVVNSETRPAGKAIVLKVAHHGSRNADNPDVWERMVAANPYAVVTPFSFGGVFLPTPQDIGRLLSRSDRVYSTAKPGGTRPRPRIGAVDNLADRLTRDRRTLRTSSVGHVRLRWKAAAAMDDDRRVHRCKGALRLLE